VSDHVYKHIQLTGSSTESYQKAIENAVERAAKTVKHMRWFELVDSRGHIENGKVTHWQATIKVGFTLED
jgi:flavin-binding protein dodecin